MEPAPVALDILALQPGSGADGRRRRLVADLARALHREGRLVAALMAPELPPPAGGDPGRGRPPGLPPELLGPGAGLLRWDTRAEARALLRRHPRLEHHIPAPLLFAEPGDPAGLVVSRHWAEAGTCRVVYLEPEDVARLEPPRSPRLEARLEWIAASHRVVGEAADEVLDQRPAVIGRPEPAIRHLPYHLAVFGPFPPGGGGIGQYNARFVAAVAASNLARVDAVTVSGMAWAPPPGVELVHAESFGTDIRPASYDWVVYTLGNSDGHLPTVEAALRHPGWLWLHEARLPAVATTAFDSFDDERFAQAMDRLLEHAYPGRAPTPAARTAGRSHLALAAGGIGLTAPLVERSAGVLVNSTAARHALELDLTPLAWRPPISVLPPACPEPRRPDRNDDRDDDHPAQSTVPEPDLVVSFGVVSMGKRPDLLVDAAALAGCRLAFVGPCPEILQTVIRDRAAARGIADHVEVAGRQDDAGYRAWLRRATIAVQLRDSAGGEMSAAVLDALAAGVPVLTNLASAADFPPGTLQLLPDTDPEAATLARSIQELLGGAGPGLEAAAHKRAQLSAAGRRFAEEHRMAHLAETVIDLLRQAHG